MESDYACSNMLDIEHVQCNMMKTAHDNKIKRLFRADSDSMSVVDNTATRTFSPKPRPKELKRQSSVGNVLSAILNKSRDQINSLFNRTLISIGRRNSQANFHGNVCESREDLPDLQENRTVLPKNKPTKSSSDFSPVKHCDWFSVVLDEEKTECDLLEATTKAVPTIKSSLSPSLHSLQTGKFKLPKRSFNSNRTTLETRHHSIDIPIPPIIFNSSPNKLSVLDRDNRYQMTLILDYLYISCIESAFNESVLCKANINALVDIANVPAKYSLPGRTLDCPCFCVNKVHFRSKLYIAVDDIEWENMEQYFEEINNFIEGARKCGKAVLIYSYHGKSRAPAAAIQYLMSNYGISLAQAYRTVKDRKPDICINRGLWKALERLDKKVVKREGSLDIIKSYQTFTLTPPKIKSAWLDC